MANQFNQNLTFAGLGTLPFTVPFDGVFFFEGKTSLPTLATGSSPSSCLVTIKQNTVTKYTGVAGDEGFYKTLPCLANDLIEIVFSSAAAVDQGLNVIKSVISIGLGV